MKIHITGNAGSGKSTLARQLAEKTSLPLYGLDKIVWKSGWQKTPIDERRKLEAELVAKPRWIIEGVSKTIRDAADLVVFIDRSRVTCVFRCLKRNLPYLFYSRPELPPKCPEILIVPKLLTIIYRFPVLVGRKIVEESYVPTNSRKIIRLCSDKEVDDFVRGFSLGLEI